MDARDLVGATLIVGFVMFFIGAVRWRLAYDRPLAETMPLVHRDRERRSWIHVWMLVATIVTPAGIGGFAALPGPPLARAVALMAAVAYTIGAVCWAASLAFRLTVGAWAAERTVQTGAMPDGFAAFDAWAGSLYTVHMAVSYATFAVLGAAVVASDITPDWTGWLGVGWGGLFLTGFVATRFAGPFNPPFWAHAYPLVLGIVLLVTAG